MEDYKVIHLKALEEQDRKIPIDVVKNELAREFAKYLEDNFNDLPLDYWTEKGQINYKKFIAHRVDVALISPDRLEELIQTEKSFLCLNNVFGNMTR